MIFTRKDEQYLNGSSKKGIFMEEEKTKNQKNPQTQTDEQSKEKDSRET